MKINQKALVVTGVSSGIGYEIAHYHIKRDFIVFGSVRKESDGRKVRQALGENFVPLYFDVTDSDAVASAVKQVEASVGKDGIAGLVNNAGISIPGPLMHVPLTEIRSLFEVNLFGLISVTQAFLPLLGASEKPTHPPGRIVNVGSVSGAFAVPFMGTYSASKHALEAVSQAFRRELKIYGIEVSIIEPYFIKSKIFEKQKILTQDNRYLDTAYADYWQIFLKMFEKFDKKAQTADVVTKTVYKALTTNKPKTRYPLHPIWWIGRLLSDRVFDNLIFKDLGLKKMQNYNQ